MLHAPTKWREGSLGGLTPSRVVGSSTPLNPLYFLELTPVPTSEFAYGTPYLTPSLGPANPPSSSDDVLFQPASPTEKTAKNRERHDDGTLKNNCLEQSFNPPSAPCGYKCRVILGESCCGQTKDGPQCAPQRIMTRAFAHLLSQLGWVLSTTTVRQIYRPTPTMPPAGEYGTPGAMRDADTQQPAWAERSFSQHDDALHGEVLGRGSDTSNFGLRNGIPASHLHIPFSVAATCNAVTEAVVQAHADGCLPILVGGDHCLAMGSVRGSALWFHRRWQSLLRFATAGPNGRRASLASMFSTSRGVAPVTSVCSACFLGHARFGAVPSTPPPSGPLLPVNSNNPVGSGGFNVAAETEADERSSGSIEKLRHKLLNAEAELADPYGWEEGRMDEAREAEHQRALRELLDASDGPSLAPAPPHALRSMLRALTSDRCQALDAAPSSHGSAHALDENELCVIWIDAHADVNTPSSSPTGNLHGMPLAALLGIQDMTWNAPGFTDGRFHVLRSDRVAWVGLRDVDDGERAVILRAAGNPHWVKRNSTTRGTVSAEHHTDPYHRTDADGNGGDVTSSDGNAEEIGSAGGSRIVGRARETNDDASGPAWQHRSVRGERERRCGVGDASDDAETTETTAGLRRETDGRRGGCVRADAEWAAARRSSPLLPEAEGNEDGDAVPISCAFDMNDVDTHGVEPLLERVLQKFPPQAPLHVSFDVDALDPLDAPSTGTPVDGGLRLHECLTLLRGIRNTGRLVSVDVVEVNPALGNDLDVARTVGCAQHAIAHVLGSAKGVFHVSSPTEAPLFKTTQ